MLVILTTLIAFWSGFGGLGGGVAHFAHLGGYAGSYLYLRWLDRARGAFRRHATTPPVIAAAKMDKWRSIDPNKVHEVNREQVNRLLDKIARHGLDSLTGEERIFLSNFVPTDDVIPPVH
jgi:hypothetical protein